MKRIGAAAGQRIERRRFLERLSPEQRERLRQRWQNMSEDEREAFRAEMRRRWTRFGGGQEPLRVIEQEISRVRAEQSETLSELRAILELARREKAEQTAKRLEALIEKQQRRYRERLRRLELRRQRAREMMESLGRGEREVTGRKKAPDFTLKSFDGKEVRLSDLRGKIVVLEWLNFECPFSRYHYETKKTMIELANKYKDKGVVWLAINSTHHTTPEANKAFSAKHRLPYPILDDRSGKVGHLYGAKTTPHMFVIDRFGRIAYDGAIDNAPLGRLPQGQQLVNYVDKVLSELLDGRLVSTPKTKSYGCSVKYQR